MATGQRGVALDLFVYVVYVAPVNSKHESESLFETLVTNITEVQTLRGIILLRGDFNACIATLLNTIDTNDLCELLQVLELVETKQPGTVAKQQNHYASVGGWGHELLDLCCDNGLFIFNGRMFSDESREFICLANGGCSTIDYIVGSFAIWQATTHFKVIIDGTHYCMVGGDSNHRPLHLQFNIDCSFVEPQHIVETKKFLPKFKYDKSKAEEYQLALTTSPGNLWVIYLIGHMGADGLVDLLQQCVGVVAKSTFGNKPLGGSYREKHCHKP